MATSRRNNRQADSRVTNVAEKEISKSSELSNKATSRLSLALRIILFVLACVFAVLGVKGIIDASNVQSVSRLATMESVQGEPVRHALVVFSGDDSDSSVAYERNGAVGLLGKSGVSSDVLYIGASADSNVQASERRLREIVTEKASSGVSYDVIVIAGDEALSFIMGNRDLFGGIPTAYFAVTDSERARETQGAGFATGYLEEGAASLALNKASELLPSATKAIVLVDGSSTAQGLLKQLEGDTAAAPNVSRELVDTSKLSRDALAEKLSEAEEGAFVLLLSANRDAEGGAYTSTETAYFLAENSSVPVFSAMGGVGEGVCGASFIDRETEGSGAATLAIDLMNGKNALDIPVEVVAPLGMVYDAQALEANGINPDDTPSDASIINESSFSVRVLRPFAMPALFLLIAIACIAGFGIIGFRRSVQSNKAIIASRNDLQYRLYHDLLTDLPNRYALERFINDPGENVEVKSVALIDINDFTDINDTYGHAFGDDVIGIMAKRLDNVDALLLARSGGDEFTLVFDRTLEPDCPELRHIGRVFDDPVIVGDNKVEITATVGIANREDADMSQDLVVFSDLAIHYAKDNGIHQPTFYSDDMREGVERKLAITSHLKRAIAEDGVAVLWQPQVNTKTLEVYGYEALCRLKDNKYYPGDFIPVAEMSGLVIDLDRIVTRRVIEQLGRWIADGREVGVAAINFSAAQLRDKTYCDFLAELLAVNNVPASKVKIEITESMIFGNEADAEKLFQRLRSMGIALALDDFGTGYSSLYRMANRPIDYVKLDKSLVDTFMVKGKERFIDDITQLIHGLGKTIIVEGVETYEQYQMCLNFGCDIIQGYFFAKPMSAEEAYRLNPEEIVANAREVTGDKTRNADWQKYDRDERGRWTKNGKKK